MLLAPKRKPRKDSNQLQVLPTPAEHWSSSLQTVLDQPPPTLPARLAWGGTLFCAVFVAWSWFGQIDEVARAVGKLTPKGEAYKIHPIELGKVAHVAVKEGQSVKTGQVLVELDTELAAKEVERLEQALSDTRTEVLQAQILLDKTQLQAQTQAMIAQSSLQVQALEISKAKMTATNSQVVLTQLQDDAAAHQARLERLQPLSLEGAIPKDRLFEVEQALRDRQRTITEGQGNLQQVLAEADRLQVGMQEKKAEVQQTQLESQKQIQQLAIRVTELQAKINETQVLIAAAKAKLKQRFLYAPVDGVVLALNIQQPGEVVQPGQTIAEVAPKGKPLVLSTVLPSHEAGFVKTGMPVQIKLDAYPFQDFGTISGRVTRISPDSKPDERLGHVYRVEVALSRSSINAKGQTIPLKAGQTAAAEIVTRRRRIADVLLEPLKKLQSGMNL